MTRRASEVARMPAIVTGPEGEAQACELLARASQITSGDRYQTFSLLLRALVLFCDGSPTPVEVMRAATRCMDKMIALELALTTERAKESS